MADATKIPFANLGIPEHLESKLDPNAPPKALKAMAMGLVPLSPDVQLPVLYVLATMEVPGLRKAAIRTLQKMPVRMIQDNLNMRTHAKVAEFIANFREPDPGLDERIAMLRVANDRTVALVAARAGPGLCEMLARNHERLLMSPEVFVSLHGNPDCSDALLARAESFLRMQGALPDVPAQRPFQAREPEEEAPVEDVVSAPAPVVEAVAAVAPAAPDAPERTGAATTETPSGIDLMAEVEAALRGEQSPSFVAAQEQSLAAFDLASIKHGEGFEDVGMSRFNFDFADLKDTFSWELTGDLESKSYEERNQVAESLEVRLQNMTVGQKIKLAYLGNKAVRSRLIRDRNKVVASAVVRSGRLSDTEVESFAGNKNLDGEVIREICNNNEWTRKYPVKVALINNPKTPVAQAVSMVSQMQKRDLLQLTRNRNVPSVITQAALRLYKQKYNR